MPVIDHSGFCKYALGFGIAHATSMLTSVAAFALV